ncbi:copper oxidase [Weizmannia acidilactici]|jgi:FtsP/CotA-like multicopper oxidase with cupredoxin domain|uniref:Copper oxidase n=1 Tax=Weizmannia acidilactici TaxID=2607726 RepID=A0A5J4JH01_9BACI|nr:multicopper oxidase family protein [Weizmannia acidilactici]GER71373.1 copper oxidase [Weizmannia acidilactici]
MKKYALIIMLALFAVFVSACSNSGSSQKSSGDNMSNMDMSDMKNMDHSQSSDSNSNSNLPMTTSFKELSGKNITITAKKAVNKFDSKHKFTVWTFNGSVPGPTIKLKQGEKVNITLKNDLSKPVTIHWHGLVVPNSQDGIPGVTMNAVQPGKSFTYHFTATTPGTYWYHSHQDSVNQLDKGLYGALIVEGKKEQKVDKDYTLVLDDWISSGQTMDEMMGNMKMTTEDMSMYDLYTINGKSGNAIKPLTVKKGDKVRIRLINAGYLAHQFHLHGHSFKVVSTDGNTIHDPQVVKNQLISVAPGERYDIEFTADHPGTWYLESHDADKTAAKNMMQKIVYEGTTKQTDERNYKEALPVFDFTNYGTTTKSAFSLNQKYDVNYTMNLSDKVKDGQLVYTINGKSYPNTDPIEVKKGDLVKVTLKSTSKTSVHPMHLHGQSFQVLSKNGKPLTGSPIIKDTLNVKPGEEYVVAFKADNPGNWMFHCHDLHHASAGMVTMVKYKGFTPSFKVDPNAGNMPE